MVNLSLPVDTLRRFVTKICLGACLNDEHTSIFGSAVLFFSLLPFFDKLVYIIMQLLANMARAKEIEDEAKGEQVQGLSTLLPSRCLSRVCRRVSRRNKIQKRRCILQRKITTYRLACPP